MFAELKFIFTLRNLAVELLMIKVFPCFAAGVVLLLKSTKGDQFVPSADA